MNAHPAFPPLMSGRAVADPPFDAALAAARAGADPGLILYRVEPDRMAAALVLAPEVPLSEAAAMLPLCGTAFQNALGVLAPPEVAVHLAWDGGLVLNGAEAGRLRAAADTADPGAVPGWLVIGWELALAPAGDETGRDPDRTALYAEGCGDVAPTVLLESWSRHALNWIDRWERDGIAPLHAEYAGLAWRLGQPVEVLGRRGTFLGLDERLGLLLKREGTTELIPLTRLVETA